MPNNSSHSPPFAAPPPSWWLFVDHLNDPVVVLDRNYCLIHSNPSFEKIFGWTSEEMMQRPFGPAIDDRWKIVSDQLKQVPTTSVVRGIKTRWRTKEDRILNVILDAFALFDANNRPDGMVLKLQGRDMIVRSDRSRQILLRISKALHRYRSPERLLNYVTRMIQALMQVGGASVILLDEEKDEFYFQMASYENTAAGRKLAPIRFPSDKGVAGEVYRTAKHLVVEDYSNSPYAYKKIDEQIHFQTRNMLDVPLRIKDRIIGVLCAVNKKKGGFDTEDIELLSAIADVVALPIENARVNQALHESCERLRTLNEAKNSVVIHLSHELRTPISVLAASLQILKKKLSEIEDHAWKPVYHRAQRNLQRLVDMAFAVDDILHRSDGATFEMMHRLPQTVESPSTAPPDGDTPFFQQVNIEFLIHELKSPISIIESNAHMVDHFLCDTAKPSKAAHRSIGRILRGTKRVRTLLQELLEIGRSEAVCFNCQPFEPMEVVIQVLLETVEVHSAELCDRLQTIQDVRAKIDFLRTKGFRMEVQPAVEHLRMVQDKIKFQLIVANLLRNALSYRRRMVWIHLSCHKDTLTVSVRDDGPGVDPEHREKIFKRYTQVTPDPEVARSGHGLGLAISRILAHSMDGDIELESQLGHGALFKLSLPLVFDKG